MELRQGGPRGLRRSVQRVCERRVRGELLASEGEKEQGRQRGGVESNTLTRRVASTRAALRSAAGRARGVGIT
jgi:hypothetical protein